jgi:hypothetical protein
MLRMKDLPLKNSNFHGGVGHAPKPPKYVLTASHSSPVLLNLYPVKINNAEVYVIFIKYLLSISGTEINFDRQ